MKNPPNAEPAPNSHREEYLLDGAVYLKVFDEDLGRHLFFRNGSPISIRTWNSAVNRYQPMNNKLHHPSRLVRYLERRRRRILTGLVRVEGSPLGADIGCEQGHFSAALASKGARMVAVDLDPAVFSRGETWDLPILRLCSDVAWLAFRDGVFDFCLCAETLEHVDDPAKVLSELARVTRPGGRIILSVPNDALIIAAKRLLRSLGLGSRLGALSRGQAMGHLATFGRRDLLDRLPDNLRVVKAFYDKPFLLNLYLVAEVAG